MSSINVRFISLLLKLKVVRRLEMIHDLPLHAIHRRQINTATSKFKETSEETKRDQSEATSPPPFPVEDWIGPVDRKSNLHRVQFAHPKDESRTEKNYRLLKEETHRWNQEFWSKQNEKFVKAKQMFTQDMFTFRGQSTTDEDGTKRVLTAEELAEFYTRFLDQNRDTFKVYNREWYKRNICMLWPATCAAVIRLCKGFQRQS